MSNALLRRGNKFWCQFFSPFRKFNAMSHTHAVIRHSQIIAPPFFRNMYVASHYRKRAQIVHSWRCEVKVSERSQISPFLLLYVILLLYPFMLLYLFLHCLPSNTFHMHKENVGSLASLWWFDWLGLVVIALAVFFFRSATNNVYQICGWRTILMDGYPSEFPEHGHSLRDRC